MVLLRSSLSARQIFAIIVLTVGVALVQVGETFRERSVLLATNSSSAFIALLIADQQRDVVVVQRIRAAVQLLAKGRQTRQRSSACYLRYLFGGKTLIWADFRLVFESRGSFTIQIDESALRYDNLSV